MLAVRTTTNRVKIVATGHAFKEQRDENSVIQRLVAEMEGPGHELAAGCWSQH